MSTAEQQHARQLCASTTAPLTQAIGVWVGQSNGQCGWEADCIGGGGRHTRRVLHSRHSRKALGCRRERRASGLRAAAACTQLSAALIELPQLSSKTKRVHSIPSLPCTVPPSSSLALPCPKGLTAMRLQIWPAPPSRHCSGGSAPVQQGSEAQEAPRATHVLRRAGGKEGGRVAGLQDVAVTPLRLVSPFPLRFNQHHHQVGVACITTRYPADWQSRGQHTAAAPCQPTSAPAALGCRVRRVGRRAGEGRQRGGSGAVVALGAAGRGVWQHSAYGMGQQRACDRLHPQTLSAVAGRLWSW